MTSGRRHFYRDKFNGKLLGVFSGLQDYLGVNALWLRLLFLVALFLTGGVLIPVYFIVGFLTNNKPPHMYTEYNDHLTRVFSDGPIERKAATRKESEL